MRAGSTRPPTAYGKRVATPPRGYNPEDQGPPPSGLSAPMFARARQFLELIRFSHTVFALPFALFAALLAWREPDSPFQIRHLAGILLCMVFARSAAMAFNRLVDRTIDAGNPRTAKRHLPAG